MRRLLDLLARLYPAEWRSRYGAEFDALLDDVSPGWAVAWDVLQGGIRMHTRRSRVTLSAAGCGIAGALVGGLLAAATPDRFTSHAVFRLDYAAAASQADRLEYDAPAFLRTALSRDNIARIVERRHLYRDERASGQMRLEDAADRLRTDIAVMAGRDSGKIVRLSFHHRDPKVAHLVAADLTAQLSESRDVSGTTAQVIDPPMLPREPEGPNRAAMAGAGFGSGSMLGAALALVFQRRRPSAP